MNSTSLRLFPFAIVGLLFVVGCSSADDSASSTATATATATASTSTEASAEDTTTTVDNRTPEEIAIDRLDILMFGLGVTDLEGSANCVVARLESENIEVTGEGTPELIALFGCDENAMSRWLPATNPALPTEAWSCAIESIGDWIGGRSIPDAQAFFEASEPPAELIELTATACDVSEEQLRAAF